MEQSRAFSHEQGPAVPNTQVRSTHWTDFARGGILPFDTSNIGVATSSSAGTGYGGDKHLWMLGDSGGHLGDHPCRCHLGTGSQT